MVFKLKYNVLAVSQVLLGAINIFLLYHTYGTDVDSAAFLLSLSIVSSIQLILASFSEQFVFYFHAAVARSKESGSQYYSSVFFTFLLISLLVGGIAYKHLGIVLKLSASGLAPDASSQTLRVLNVLALSLLFYLPAQVTQAVISARGQISISYLLSSIPSFFQFAGIMAASMYKASVLWVAAAWTTGQLVSLLVGCLFAMPKIPNRATYNFSAVIDTLVSSIKVRCAHNIHNFLLIFIINNYTSTLATNYSALFFYVKRVTETFLNVVYGPTQKMLVNVIATGTQSGQRREIRESLKKTDRIFPPLFVMAAVLGWMLIPYLTLLKPLNAGEITFVQISFLLLITHTLLMAVEMPYAIVSMARHASMVFYISNTVFIFLLCGLTYTLMKYVPHYALALSMCIAQLGNFTIIRSSSRKYIG